MAGSSVGSRRAPGAAGDLPFARAGHARDVDINDGGRVAHALSVECGRVVRLFPVVSDTPTS
jgi:hypothetical protein